VTAWSFTGNEREASLADSACNSATLVSTPCAAGASERVDNGPSSTAAPVLPRTGNAAISSRSVSESIRGCKVRSSSPVESRNHCSRPAPLAIMLPRNRTRRFGSEPAIRTASATVATGSDATSAPGETATTNFRSGLSSNRSSFPDWFDVRRRGQPNVEPVPAQQQQVLVPRLVRRSAGHAAGANSGAHEVLHCLVAVGSQNLDAHTPALHYHVQGLEAHTVYRSEE